jgi:hypothetical protein
MAIAMRKRMLELQDVWRASGIEKPVAKRRSPARLGAIRVSTEFFVSKWANLSAP